jgi:hypothetical protein
MGGDGEIAHTIARDITMSYESTPPVEIPAQRRETIEGRYREREDQLADDGHRKPKPHRSFQGGVGNRTQVPAVGHYFHQYGAAHNRLLPQNGIQSFGRNSDRSLIAAQAHRCRQDYRGNYQPAPQARRGEESPQTEVHHRVHHKICQALSCQDFPGPYEQSEMSCVTTPFDNSLTLLERRMVVLSGKPSAFLRSNRGCTPAT